jgi:hypothetical protein
MRWIFNLPNRSNLSVTMCSTQPLPQRSVKGDRRVMLITLKPSLSQLFREHVGASTSHNPMGLHGLLQGYS